MQMKNIIDLLLYFFLGIDRKRKTKSKKSKFRAISETNAVIPGEAFDILPHIDFVYER